MDATVAERGQITLPKAVRDALGLTKGSKLRVEIEGSRIVMRKDVDDAISRVRGCIPLPPGISTDDIMRELRGRAPSDPVPDWDRAAPAKASPQLISEAIAKSNTKSNTKATTKATTKAITRAITKSTAKSTTKPFSKPFSKAMAKAAAGRRK
jgi:antitoxin PrlF